MSAGFGGIFGELDMSNRDVLVPVGRVSAGLKADGWQHAPVLLVAEYLDQAAEEIKALRMALLPLAECHLPPAGFEQHGVTAHFTTAQIVAAKDAMPPNV